MNCWHCGAEPADVYEVESLEQADTIATFVRWSAITDHIHADRPPTPQELAEQGHRSLLTIQEQWTA